MTMGDMKTPDFDDLLAAFDIPDMVDPKAAIESGHDDHESHIKQNAHVDDDSHTPSSSDVGVSVIVKNVRNIDSSEGVEKDGHNPTGNGLHNGFLTASSLDSYGKDGAKSLKGDTPASEVTLKDPAFSQFSPISSAEEFEDDEKIEVDDPPDKEEARAGFRSNVLTGSAPQQDFDKLKALGGENSSKTGVSTSGHTDKNKVKREAESNSITLSVYEPFKVRKAEDKLKENSEKMLESRVLDGKPSSEKSDSGIAAAASSKTKPSSKLSSCIAAIAALSAKKAASDSCKEPVANSREASPLPKEVNDSPKAADKSPESQNLIDGTKKASLKPSDSPRSVSSENSSKGSPSSPVGSTPAIPKVRIKTIKTSSGEIKRTVTRVLPEVDLDSGKKPSEQAASVMASVTSLLSSSASATVLSSPPRAPLQTAMVTSAVSSAELTPKQVTIKPVATAFLPVSAVKTAGSQVINLKLANNTTVKATVISAASVQSASSAIIKAANAIQQQTVVVPASSLANAKLVPKTVHLANLNLLPQGAQATSELRQVLTKPQQQIKQAIINAAASQPPKKVSRVQVVSSLQSSVVEAFNKVLSSVNPVPVYTPNLSPPANAGITLPMRGYKCLECGDAFALEKSLSQHYDRRSVRIEVTCNHCTKNLVFYNKCSLLSHARGHKEKGVVMQCSHLILKPVPADQMIVPPSSNTAASTLQSSVGAATHTVPKVQPGIAGAVISAPASTPMSPAMPLDEDPSKLCRHSLKCLECNEVFQDEPSLATHFQHAADTSGQQMKKHPCRQCDKSFSSSHSLCRHNRIKHKGIRKVYACSHCPDSRRTFTKRLMLERHIQLMHGIKDPDVKELSDDAGDVTNDEEEEAEIKEDAKVPSPKRKLEEPVLEFRPPRGAITQPLKKLKINVFKVHKCAVCGFTTENLLQFHEHIPQHRSDGSSHQCRECGLCYTSHGSLARHLFIVHKLKEPQPVSKQNGAGEDSQQENKPSPEDEAAEGAASDRKCKVCAKTFETEAALNTHMRTHGMAFIKSKRMSSAEK
ncbi:zinc finger protein 532 isoform 2 [Mus musculus]|uniref:Zinc finger protein 532 n=1 Tax=Mus musculus TaxID=10090 RepID=ZN532_MOUSE|nr:zinc finger protein 532 isoform 2 [Mus musculus]Q6NXK2.1 RecName: Full=Zinc finger protein 532 [Mus musculus]AAH67032.1 Zinc finger protein 532 [Mus musculus]|eukprot:NP_997138.1 zinc finger protein 532 isoform 2 [Mus musculus]